MNKEEFQDILANQLFVCRQEAKLTFPELSELSNISVGTLHAIEHKKTIPSVYMIYKLAQVYQKDISFFFDINQRIKSIDEQIADKFVFTS